MTEELRSEVRGTVLTLTINRPERRNAMSPAVVQGLREAIVGANRDGAIRAMSMALNDSGIAVPAMMLGVLNPVLVRLALRTNEIAVSPALHR